MGWFDHWAAMSSFNPSRGWGRNSGGGPPLGLPFPVGLLPEAAATFQDVSGWPTGSGWDFTGGRLNMASASAEEPLYELDSPLVAGRQYMVYIYMSDYVSGGCRFRAEGGTNFSSDVFVSARHFVFPYTPAGNHTLVGIRGTALNATIEKFQIYDVTDRITAPQRIFLTVGQSQPIGKNSVTGFVLADQTPDTRVLSIAGSENAGFGFQTDGSGPSINSYLPATKGIGVPRFVGNPQEHSTGNGDNDSQGVGLIPLLAKYVADRVDPAGPSHTWVCANWGGSDLSVEWNPLANPALTDAAAAYDLAVANVEYALSLNPANYIAGLIYHHGETYDPDVNFYAADAAARINDFRGRWGKFPVVILEHGGDPTLTGNINMKAQQVQLATGSGSMFELERCVYLDRPSGWALEDGTHYTGTTFINWTPTIGAALVDLIDGYNAADFS